MVLPFIPVPMNFLCHCPPRSNDFFQCFHSSLYKHNCILTLLFSVFFCGSGYLNLYSFLAVARVVKMSDFVTYDGNGFKL